MLGLSPTSEMCPNHLSQSEMCVRPSPLSIVLCTGGVPDRVQGSRTCVQLRGGGWEIKIFTPRVGIKETAILCVGL